MDTPATTERYECFGCHCLVFKKKDAYMRHLKKHLDISSLPPVISDDVQVKRMKLKIDVLFNLALYGEMDAKVTEKLSTVDPTEQSENNESLQKTLPDLTEQSTEMCQICKIEVGDLIVHMEYVHNMVKETNIDTEEESVEIIACDECDEKFTKKCDLIRHRMQHIMRNQMLTNVENEKKMETARKRKIESLPRKDNA